MALLRKYHTGGSWPGTQKGPDDTVTDVAASATLPQPTGSPSANWVRRTVHQRALKPDGKRDARRNEGSESPKPEVDFKEGTVQWFRFWIRFSDPLNLGADFNIPFQTHVRSGGTQPNVALEINGSNQRPFFTTNAGGMGPEITHWTHSAAVAPSTTYAVRIGVKHSVDKNVGWVTLYWDGALKVDRAPAATLSTATAPRAGGSLLEGYVKKGLYQHFGYAPVTTTYENGFEVHDTDPGGTATAAVDPPTGLAVAQLAGTRDVSARVTAPADPERTTDLVVARRTSPWGSESNPDATGASRVVTLTGTGALDSTVTDTGLSLGDHYYRAFARGTVSGAAQVAVLDATPSPLSVTDSTAPVPSSAHETFPGAAGTALGAPWVARLGGAATAGSGVTCQGDGSALARLASADGSVARLAIELARDLSLDFAAGAESRFASLELDVPETTARIDVAVYVAGAAGVADLFAAEDWARLLHAHAAGASYLRVRENAGTTVSLGSVAHETTEEASGRLVLHLLLDRTRVLAAVNDQGVVRTMSQSSTAHGLAAAMALGTARLYIDLRTSAAAESRVVLRRLSLTREEGAAPTSYVARRLKADGSAWQTGDGPSLHTRTEHAATVSDTDPSRPTAWQARIAAGATQVEGSPLPLSGPPLDVTQSLALELRSRNESPFSDGLSAAATYTLPAGGSTAVAPTVVRAGPSATGEIPATAIVRAGPSDTGVISDLAGAIVPSQR